MSSRTYVVGLPVLVTVDDDGTVTYEIDTAETGQAILEEGTEGATDEQVENDAAAADEDHERRAYLHYVEDNLDQDETEGQ